MNRESVALISYWALFVVLPAAAIFALLGVSVWSFLSIPVLVLAGEHGFHWWPRICRLPVTKYPLHNGGTKRSSEDP